MVLSFFLTPHGSESQDALETNLLEPLEIALRLRYAKLAAPSEKTPRRKNVKQTERTITNRMKEG